MSRTRSASLFAVAAALAAYAPVRTVVEDGTLGAFRQLAADSFYYLAVATRSAGADFFTFDGSHPTNGFHPLWQILLERCFAWLSPDSEGLVLLALGVGIALVSVGTGLLAVAALRMTGRPALALLAVVPGAFYVLVPGATESGVGAPWSYANGMESPLSIFFFGALLVLVTAPSAPDRRDSTAPLLVVSALLTLLTLSRLDDVFLFAPFLLYVAWSAHSRREAVRRVALTSVIPTVALGSYLAYNLISAGTLLPSSGASKAAPLWAFARNAYAVLTTLLPAFGALVEGAGSWRGESWRVAQMGVPALVAAAWLWMRGAAALRGTGRAAWHETVLTLLAGYVLLKAAYNFSNVALWHQGHWYFPVSIMTCNLIAAAAVASWADALKVPVERWVSPLAFVMAAILALWWANVFVDELSEPRPRDRRHVFWSERAQVRSLLERTCSGCGVLSFDDGIVAFSLPETPTLNGLGLTLDAEALRARREGRLLDLAWERGVRLLTSVSYEMPDAAFQSPESLRSHLESYAHIEGQDLDGWRFELAFEAPASGVHFVRFAPR